MSKNENKQLGEKKTAYVRITGHRKKLKTSRKFKKQYARSTMEKYVRANITKAMNKLKRAKKNKYYQASPELKRASSQLRTLYRKLGKNADQFYKSKSFIDTIKSNSDFAVLYRSVRDIMDLDMRKLSKEYQKMKSMLAERGIDFDSTFDTLSFLSSNFHDIFAFLSYNRVSRIIENGGDTFDIFEEFLAESQDTYLDLRDEQKLYRDRGLQKIKDALNPRDYALMQARLRGRGIKI